MLAVRPSANSIYRHPLDYDAAPGYEYFINGLVQVGNARHADISVDRLPINRHRTPAEYDVPVAIAKKSGKHPQVAQIKKKREKTGNLTDL